MPLQNRVTPEGEIEAVPQRGTMFGNRGGCFHTSEQTLLRRHFASKQWICCVLAFKGRKRHPLMQPGRYTELFFLDEATAIAAGHRPCFECRRPDAMRFAELWNAALGLGGRAAAPAMDDQLQRERIDGQGRKIVTAMRAGDLPDFSFVRIGGLVGMKQDERILPWSFDGYKRARRLAAETTVETLTPAGIVSVLRQGYKPQIHISAEMS